MCCLHVCGFVYVYACVYMRVCMHACVYVYAFAYARARASVCCLWVCVFFGCVGVWVCGCGCVHMGMCMCGFVGVWVCGCVGVGVWACGYVGAWVRGCMGACVDALHARVPTNKVMSFWLACAALQPITRDFVGLFGGRAYVVARVSD